MCLLKMDNKHRNHIMRNVDELVQYTDYKRLMDGCVAKGLLSLTMRSRIDGLHGELDKDDIERLKHKELFHKITKRGPDAYRKLKELLTGYPSAMSILNDVENNCKFTSIRESKLATTALSSAEILPPMLSGGESVGDYPGQPELVEYTRDIPPKYEVKTTDVTRRDDDVGTYPMSPEGNPGVLFVVNIEKFQDEEDYRRGSMEDLNAVLDVFKQLDFHLFAYNNIKAQDFFYLLSALLNTDLVKQAGCFVMALMSHGCIKNDWQHVKFTDGSDAKVKEILQYFNDSSCPNLVNKPKIFLFPFCRGEVLKSDIKKVPQQNHTQSKCTDTLPDLTDTLICYAADPGYKTLRDPQKGSWYMQTLCEVLAKNAHEKHFEDMLKITQDKICSLRSEEGDRQTPIFSNHSFNKKLFFYPIKK